MLCAAVPAACLAAYEFAYRLPAEIQTPGPEALEALTWQQGSTPLIQVDVLRRGRPVNAGTNTTVRMIIGPSATGTYYAVATNTPGTNTSYYVQWPTIGTNSCGTGTTAQAWFYTVYFEAAGKRYWTGNGDLYIEKTTSTDPDGLVWQTNTSGYAVWGTVTGTLSNQTDLWAALAGKATGTPVYAESDPVWEAAKSGYATGTPIYAETDPVWENEKAGYATGTPVYAETDPVWENEKAGYATGTPVYAESDPVWAAVSNQVQVDLTNLVSITSNRAEAIRAELTNTVEVTSNAFVAADAVITGYVAAVSNSVDALNAATNVLDAAMKSAFQNYTATNYPGAGETVTVAYANGNLVKVTATNGLTTFAFDNTAYPTAGVSRVAVNLWAGTNGIGFDDGTITNETAPTIPTNAWKGLMFRRIEGGLWYGREY